MPTLTIVHADGRFKVLKDGEQIISQEAEEASDCPHPVHADMEEPGQDVAHDNDLCFVLLEPALASRHHYFVPREVVDGTIKTTSDDSLAASGAAHGAT